MFALLAENTIGKSGESRVQNAELLETLIAYPVQGFKVLICSDVRFEQEGSRMCSLLSFEIERIGRTSANLRQL